MLHSRQSAHRLASELMARLNLSAQSYPDSYYATVDTVQQYGIITAYYCCKITLDSTIN